MISVATFRLPGSALRRYPSQVMMSFTTLQQRNYKSTQAVERPEEESHFLLILGPPGGGKGTISKKMLKDFSSFHHVSTGDLLRQHVRQRTALGIKAKGYMDSGELVPDNLMIDLVMEDATPYLEAGQSLLLDGFPRTIEQAMALEKVTHIDVVVNLDVPTDTIVERLADRWIHPASGRVYSYSYNPPKVAGKDDITGEDLVQRDDDKPEAIRKRLESYANITAPLVKYYEDKGLARTFSGTKSDVIYPQVKKFLESTHFFS
ncbi:nucleoside-triphosphate--adenylate kinase [Fistulifera solaris]|uniref:GTP:AMP phosphotransferase, mitochondrial n=1 Tax=Fistulifera solaris TaxID=1519565 RepID=A0A1Z5J9X8_FISSO|nr:nucleoside-triphosphate--adenylate kinase [Fistulifera solaris]|eukprot:GAX10795.1 nucleoside-triphosphate--adenylate kinase [Fistulifera solaris]